MTTIQGARINALLRESVREIVRDEALQFGRPIATPSVQEAHAPRHYQRVYVQLRALDTAGVVTWLHWSAMSRLAWWWWSDATAVCHDCGRIDGRLRWVGGSLSGEPGREFIPGSGVWACDSGVIKKPSACAIEAFGKVHQAIYGRQ